MQVNVCLLFEVPYKSISHISLSSLTHFSPFPRTLMLMEDLLEWCLRFSESIWCPILGIWCMEMLSYVYILCNSKYKKSMCENLAFSCYLITSFHEFGFKLERVLYQICMMNFIYVLHFWEINLYVVYGHYISCYYLNHLFYFSCVKLKLVMQFPWKLPYKCCT